MYKVSVIVPICDADTKVCRCINSLINQTLSQIEIILIDDGSTDDSPKMCDEYAKRYPFITVIHKDRAGKGYAKNSGLEVATGEYVAFVDARDYLDGTALLDAYNKAKEYNVDYVRFGFQKIDEQGTPVKKAKSSPLPEGLYDRENIRNKILLQLFGRLPYETKERFVESFCCGLYKRSVLVDNDIKFLSERDIVDEDLIFNVLFMQYINTAYVIDSAPYYKTVRVNSKKPYRNDLFEKCLQLYTTLLELLKRTGYYDVGRLRVNRTFLIMSNNCIRHELMNNPNKKQAKENVTKILNNQLLKDLLVAYPIKQMPLKYRFGYTIVKKRNRFLIALFKNKL